MSSSNRLVRRRSPGYPEDDGAGQDPIPTPREAMRQGNCQDYRFHRTETYPSIRPRVPRCDPSKTMAMAWLANSLEADGCGRPFDVKQDDGLLLWQQSPHKGTLGFYGIGSPRLHPEAVMFNQVLMASLGKASVVKTPKLRSTRPIPPTPPKKTPLSEFPVPKQMCQPFILNRRALKTELQQMPIVQRRLHPRTALESVFCPDPVDPYDPLGVTQHERERVSRDQALDMERLPKKRPHGLRRRHWYCPADCGGVQNACSQYEWAKYKLDPRPYNREFRQWLSEQKEVKSPEPKDYDQLYERFLKCFEQEPSPDPLSKIYEICCATKSRVDDGHGAGDWQGGGGGGSGGVGGGSGPGGEGDHEGTGGGTHGTGNNNKDKDGNKDKNKDQDRDTGKDTIKNTGKDTGKDSGKESGKDPGQDSGKDTGKDSGKESGKDLGKKIGIDKGKDQGKNQDKNIKDMDKSKGSIDGKTKGKGDRSGDDATEGDGKHRVTKGPRGSMDPTIDQEQDERKRNTLTKPADSAGEPPGKGVPSSSRKGSMEAGDGLDKPNVEKENVPQGSTNNNEDKDKPTKPRAHKGRNKKKKKDMGKDKGAKVCSPCPPQGCPCEICTFMKRCRNEPDAPFIQDMKMVEKKRQLLIYYRQKCHREYIRNCSREHLRAPLHKCDPISCDNTFCRNPYFGRHCECLEAVQDLQKLLAGGQDKRWDQKLLQRVEHLRQRISQRMCDCILA